MSRSNRLINRQSVVGLGLTFGLGLALWVRTAEAGPAQQSKVVEPQPQSPTATYSVTNTNDSGAGSLRQAIFNANANPGADLITFGIGTGQQTISPASPLPAITGPVTIDGTTQPGYTGLPLIELSGAGAGANAVGLDITGGGSTIKGLAINGFNGHGILISGAGGNSIVGNCIGTNVTCDAAQGNRNGVFISNSPNNYVGGAVAGSRNIISGNTVDGVRIDGSGATGNFVQRNYIGMNISGTLAVPNLFNGVTITGAGNNTIGGPTGAARNLISGNNRYGVGIANNGASGNQVLGNYIGSTADGNSSRFNNSGGVIIQNATGNTIGVSGAGNIVSGNNGNAVIITGTLSMSNTVQANTIGMDSTGLNTNPNDEGVLIYNASNNTIGGVWGTTGNLISGNWQGPGVRIYGSNARNNVVKGNRIGTDINGATVQSNRNQGVLVEAGASNNTIGGTGAGEGNLISGNQGQGVEINGSATTGNVLLGNVIGLNAAGTADVPNDQYGVYINNAPGNTVGGTVAGSRNTISGNGDYYNLYGVLVEGSAASGNTVLGNYIGTNTAGNASIPNGVGISISEAPNNTIGGATAAARNIISGNELYGILLVGDAATGNVVQGNYIGTTSAGNAALPNGGAGLRLALTRDGADNRIINNVISGNSGDVTQNYGNGIDLAYGTRGAVVQGNLIGVTANGSAKLPNAGNGILVSVAVGNTIGGTTAGTRNVIAGNGDNGIEIEGDGTTLNQVLGNYIGTNSAGANLGNTGHGVYVNNVPGNTVGGTVAGSGNVIAFNGGDGVYVEGQNGYQTGIHLNSIHSNGGLGIDLGTNGVTANDNCDADQGPNMMQNVPAITSAGSGGGSITIQGSLNSVEGGTYRIEFFSNVACDPSNCGEGQTYLGFTTVTLDSGCQKTFTANLPVTVAVGAFISATATDESNNTSEFSACRVVSAQSTPTPTQTHTATRTSTSTATKTSTPINTSTHTATRTATSTTTHTKTSTRTATRTATATTTATGSATRTATRTNTPIAPLATSTRTATRTQTYTPVPDATSTRTFTPVATGTGTIQAPSSTSIPGATNTTGPGATSTFTPVASATADDAQPTATSGAPCEISFSDVDASNPFYIYIRCLVCRGVVGGFGDNTFRPGANITRGQVAKYLSNAAGFVEEVSGQSFTDVPPDHTFYAHIERLVRRNIISGYNTACETGAPCFRPQTPVTRGQVTKMAANAAGFFDTPPQGTQTFTDVPPDDTFWVYVERLVAKGVMSGYACGNSPDEPCDEQNRAYFRSRVAITRGQMAKIVSNTFFPECAD